MTVYSIIQNTVQICNFVFQSALKKAIDAKFAKFFGFALNERGKSKLICIARFPHTGNFSLVFTSLFFTGNKCRLV